MTLQILHTRILNLADAIARNLRHHPLDPLPHLRARRAPVQAGHAGDR